jgi:hypothetical protein
MENEAQHSLLCAVACCADAAVARSYCSAHHPKSKKAKDARAELYAPENIDRIRVKKKCGEALGMMILPAVFDDMMASVFIANLAEGSPAERYCFIGDQVLAVNGQSFINLDYESCKRVLGSLRDADAVGLELAHGELVCVCNLFPSDGLDLGFSICDGFVREVRSMGSAYNAGLVDGQVGTAYTCMFLTCCFFVVACSCVSDHFCLL